MGSPEPNRPLSLEFAFEFLPQGWLVVKPVDERVGLGAKRGGK